MPTACALLFCFDGTANNPEDMDDFAEDGRISNILKLYAIFGGDFNSGSGNWQQTDVAGELQLYARQSNVILIYGKRLFGILSESMSQNLRDKWNPVFINVYSFRYL